MAQHEKQSFVLYVTELHKTAGSGQESIDYLLYAPHVLQLFESRLALQKRDNVTGFFHTLIIAFILLNLGGCGYKKPPYYEEKIDDNVNVVIEKGNE